MTQKLKYLALEPPPRIAGGINSSLHEDLLKEMKSFVMRNSLTAGNHCCRQCMKAHLIKKAKQMDIISHALPVIERNFNCETGHEGYYLDRGRLIKV